MEHLEGITILNEYMTYETPWFVLLLIFLTVISAVVASFCASNGKELACTIAFACFLILLIFATIGLCGVWDIETEMVYECTVADDITYKELTETYKIIEQRGDIYKLKFLNN